MFPFPIRPNLLYLIQLIKVVIFSFFSLFFILFLEDKILKISREKPWARLLPRPTGREIVTLIRNLRTDADHGLLGNLPRLYSTIGGDSSRDMPPPGQGRRRFSLQPQPTPTNRKFSLKETDQASQTTVIYQAGTAT